MKLKVIEFQKCKNLINKIITLYNLFTNRKKIKFIIINKLKSNKKKFFKKKNNIK